MPDDNTPDAGDGDDKGGQGFKPITSQEDFDKALAKRLERERAKFADYDDVKAKAAEFDKAAEASKSELQKAIERAEAAEKRAAEFEAKEQRQQWAADIVKGTDIPITALRGTTREELEEHFAVLSSLIKPTPGGRTATPPGRPAPGEGEKGRAAAALRALRQG